MLVSAAAVAKDAAWLSETQVVDIPSATAIDQKARLIRTNDLLAESTGIRPYMSYVFDKSSCYIDSAQELWFRAFSLWDPATRESFLRITVPKQSVLWSLLDRKSVV